MRWDTRGGQPVRSDGHVLSQLGKKTGGEEVRREERMTIAQNSPKPLFMIDERGEKKGAYVPKRMWV